VLNCQTDRLHGGWYARVSEDGSAVVDPLKANAWKTGYHDGRAVMVVVETLRAMATRSA
jgi:mannose/cellobiose epimerase-like protein (N-acyl-D-glucosamine 2-epimerase family)